VLGTGEEQEQGIATELHESAAIFVGDAEKVDKALADRGGELFGADLAVLGEPLGELGETGNVDKGDRALYDAVPLAGRCRDPVDDKARQVWREELTFGGVVTGT
jgi:hypothetical protein